MRKFGWDASQAATLLTSGNSLTTPIETKAGVRRMVLPVTLTVHNSAYALDGGTTVLQATDESGRERGVMLVQHAFPQSSPHLAAVPGRLYFDGDLVPIRSEMESGVLALLRAAEVQYSLPVSGVGACTNFSRNALILGEDIRQVLNSSPGENIRTLLAAVVRFVESDEYLRFAERVEQAADATRYTVWAAWKPATRNQAIVGVGRVLGAGIHAARALLDSGAPLAAGATALEVSDLAARCSAEGLALRVEPSFRWRLVSRG